MASSSFITPDVETSFDMYGNSDLRNHSNRNSGGMVALIRLFRLLHSWIWSKMWVALFCLKVDNKSVLKSYQTRSWKWLRKALAKSQKLLKAAEGSSIYHFSAVPIKVLWNSLNLTESSFSEFEEHHKWKVVGWAPGSSPVLPSNLGMSDGNLVGTGCHKGSCLTGSFINFDKYGKFKVSKNRSLGRTGLLNVPAWALEGPAPECPWVKVGLPPATSYEVGRLL